MLIPTMPTFTRAANSRAAAGAGEDGDAVAMRMLARQAGASSNVSARTICRTGPKISSVAFEVRLHTVEQVEADEALLMALQGEAAAVDHQLCALVGASGCNFRPAACGPR